MVTIIINFGRSINYNEYGICTVCLMCISMTFEPTGDTCAILVVDVARAFGSIGHVQQSVRRMAKCAIIILIEQ